MTLAEHLDELAVDGAQLGDRISASPLLSEHVGELHAAREHQRVIGTERGDPYLHGALEQGEVLRGMALIATDARKVVVEAGQHLVGGRLVLLAQIDGALVQRGGLVELALLPAHRPEIGERRGEFRRLLAVDLLAEGDRALEGLHRLVGHADAHLGRGLILQDPEELRVVGAEHPRPRRDDLIHHLRRALEVALAHQQDGLRVHQGQRLFGIGARGGTDQARSGGDLGVGLIEPSLRERRSAEAHVQARDQGTRREVRIGLAARERILPQVDRLARASELVEDLTAQECDLGDHHAGRLDHARGDRIEGAQGSVEVGRAPEAAREHAGDVDVCSIVGGGQQVPHANVLRGGSRVLTASIQRLRQQTTHRAFGLRRVAEARLEPRHRRRETSRHGLMHRLRVLARIRRTEHLAEHLEHVALQLLGAACLGLPALGVLARDLHAIGRAHAHHQRDDETEEQRGRGGDRPRMSLHEAQAQVGRGRRSSPDRLAMQHPAQVVGEGRHRLVATVGLLAQCAGEHGLQIAAQSSIHVAERHRVLVAHPAQRAGDGVTRHVDGQTRGEQLVADDREAVDVAAHVDRRSVPRRLLRAHVGRCAEQHARQGAGRLGAVVEQPRDAEVEHACATVRVDHHIARLQVAVDHATLVRVIDRGGDLGDHAQLLVERGLHAIRPVPQDLAAHQFHGEIRRIALVDPIDLRREDLGDAGVLQTSECLRLHREAHACRRRSQTRGEHLERDLAPGLRLFRAVDHAHAAVAEHAEDAERADVRGQGRGRVRESVAQTFHVDLVEQSRLAIPAQQILDLGAQHRIAAARLAQVGRLLIGSELAGCDEEFLGAGHRPRGIVHGNACFGKGSGRRRPGTQHDGARRA